MPKTNYLYINLFIIKIMAAKKRAKIKTAKKSLAKSASAEKYALYKESVSRMLYWVTILVLAVCNFLISVLIVPLLLVVNRPAVYITIGALGFFFGFVFNLFISKVGHLEIRHHLFAAIFIPLVSVINIFILVALTNRISSLLKMGLEVNSLLIAVIYVGAFMLPYLYYSNKLRHDKKATFK